MPFLIHGFSRGAAAPPGALDIRLGPPGVYLEPQEAPQAKIGGVRGGGAPPGKFTISPQPYAVLVAAGLGAQASIITV